MARNYKEADIKKLFGLSGNKCAFEGCEFGLISNNVLIGEICHIEAESAKGPRYNPSQTDKERDAFDNLILMCPNHHKIIDKDSDSYTVSYLKELKLKVEAVNKDSIFDVPDNIINIAIDSLIQNFYTNIEEQNIYINTDNADADYGIISEMFENVLRKIKSVDTKTVDENDDRFIDVSKKIMLNFQDQTEQEHIKDIFKLAYNKITLIDDLFKELSTEDQNDLYIHLKTCYMNNKTLGLNSIGNLNALIETFTLEGKSNNPSYVNLSTAFVLFFFDCCTIFEK